MSTEEAQSEKKPEDSELHEEQPKEISGGTADDGEVYSIYRSKAKALIVVTASVTGFISPLSASIYFPALSTLAGELHVTDTLINLTVTAYMVGACNPR